jgi:hypothetical protein
VFQSAWYSAQPCHEKEASPDEGKSTIVGSADTTAQDLPLELSYQARTIRVLLVRIGLNGLNQSLVLPVQRVSMAYTTARDLPIELLYQEMTIRVLLVRIGLNKLNQSLILPAQRASMADARWKKKFRPIGRNFCLSCRQLPWSTNLPPAPPFLFRSQLRHAALWKKKSHLQRITRDKIQLPPRTRTLSRIPPLQMTLLLLLWMKTRFMMMKLMTIVTQLQTPTDSRKTTWS